VRPKASGAGLVCRTWTPDSITMFKVRRWRVTFSSSDD